MGGVLLATDYFKVISVGWSWLVILGTLVTFAGGALSRGR
jgi:hypothetical protein